MSMTSIFQKLFFFVLILMITINKIQLAIVIVRHGARTQKFSNDFKISKVKTNSIGELNDVGLRQSYIMGVELFNRYSNIFTDKNKIAEETLFAFCARNRTLQTGYAIIDGLYHYIKPPELSQKEIEHAIPPISLDKKFLRKMNNKSYDSYEMHPSFLNIKLRHFDISENLDHKNNEGCFGLEICTTGKIYNFEVNKPQHQKALSDFIMKMRNPYIKNQTNLTMFNLYQIYDNLRTWNYNDDKLIIDHIEDDLKTLEKVALYNYFNMTLGNNKTSSMVLSNFLLDSIYNLIYDAVYPSKNKTIIKLAIFTVSDINLYDILFLLDQHSVVKSPVGFLSSIIIEYSVDIPESYQKISEEGINIPTSSISIKLSKDITIYPFNQKYPKIIPELFLLNLKKVKFSNISDYKNACFNDKKMPDPVNSSYFESLEEIYLTNKQVIFSILSESMLKRSDNNNMMNRIVSGLILILVVISFLIGV